jgi:hypothetical protein
MKLQTLIDTLDKARRQAGNDAEVFLCFEETALDEGYDEASTEGISDIRLLEDWPLPGKSLCFTEGEKAQKVVIFYDNHYKLDSAKEVS